MSKVISFIDKNLTKISCKILQLEENKEYAEGNKFEKILNNIYDLKNLEDTLAWFKELYQAKKTGKYKVVLVPKELTND